MAMPGDRHTRKCPYCHNQAQFNFVKENDIFYSYFNVRINPEDEKSSVQRNDIGVFKCCVCGGPLFIRAHGPQLLNLDIYPINIPTAPAGIPDKIKTIYLEALRCFGIKAWNATATMCRRAIQECIIDKGGE